MKVLPILDSQGLVNPLQTFEILDQVTNVVPFSGKSKKELQLTNVGTHRTMRCNCMSSLNSWDSSWSQCHYCHLESPQQDEWGF